MAHTTVEGVASDLVKLEAKALELEKYIRSLEIEVIVIKQRTKEIEKDLTGIFGSFSWLWKAVFGILIAGVIGFIIKGGLVI